LSFAVLIQSLALALAGAARGGDDDEGDKKRLAGTWMIDPATFKGETNLDRRKELLAVRVIFDGDSVTFRHPPGNEEGGPSGWTRRKS
jgi:hypothetical protein